MATSELLVLHLEAGQFSVGPVGHGHAGVHPLVTRPTSAAAQLWTVAGHEDLDATASEVIGELQAQRALPAGPLDPRIVKGARELASAEGVAAAAQAVGLSRSRFRTLIQLQLGTSPTRLRTWQRLRRAVSYLPIHGVAEAAAFGGFADQPHLTRTASAWLATTPGRLRVQGRQRPAPPRFKTLPGPGASNHASPRG